MPFLHKFIENKEPMSGVNLNSPTTQNLPTNEGLIYGVHPVVTEDGTRVDEATMLALVEKYQLITGGRSYCDYFMRHLLMLDKYRLHPFRPGKAPLRFADYNRHNIADAERTGLNPQIYQNPQIRTYFNDRDAVNGVKPVPGLKTMLDTEGVGRENRAKFDKQPMAGVRPVPRHSQYIIDILSQGSTPTPYRHQHNGERIRAIHLIADNITELVISLNGQETWVFDTREDLNERLEEARLAPQDGVWHIDFEAFSKGVLDSALDPIRNNENSVIDFDIYTSNQNSVEVLVETYGTPNVKPPQV